MLNRRDVMRGHVQASYLFLVGNTKHSAKINKPP
jgi:hypothetical protein